MSNVERRELATTNPHKPRDPWWTRKSDID
jgi:hypothetical protein